MARVIRTSILAAVCAGAVTLFSTTSAPTAAAAAAVGYVLTDLGTTPAENGHAYAINDAGHVTGDDGHSAFFYRDGVKTILDNLGGAWTHGRAINASSVVVGDSESPLHQAHAFRWAQDQPMSDLGTLGGPYSWAYGVNDVGTVVGVSDNGQFSRGFAYVNGQMRDLGVFSDSYQSGATAINNHGIIVGYAAAAGNQSDHACLWHGEQMIDLDGGFGTRSYAYAINDAGQVVGSAMETGTSPQRAAMWFNGAAIELGALGSDEVNSEALGINERGEVVGWSQTAPLNNLLHAFVRIDGEMIDLNSVVQNADGWILAQATDVNNAGQIVGWGYNQGRERAFLLTPTPEPGCAVSAVFVMSTLVLRRRRRRSDPERAEFAALRCSVVWRAARRHNNVP